MRAPVEEEHTDPQPAAASSGAARPWRTPTRVAFGFDPWRGGFELTVDHRSSTVSSVEGGEKDGSVRWRTASSRNGATVVCHVQHVTRGSDSPTYVLNNSRVGAEVPMPIVRHVDDLIIVTANKVPEGEMVIVEHCDGLVSVAGVRTASRGSRPKLHIATLKVLTGALGSMRVEAQVQDVKQSV